MLGVGSSAGTPVIGCDCKTCSSNNPRNKRSRSSTIIETNSGEVILIDSSPDLRSQALRENIKRIDAVLYTHAHADHLNGIDDLRAFCQLHKKQIPLYGNSSTIENISERFAYAFRDSGNNWDLPVLKANAVHASIEVCGERVEPIPVKHGRAKILGWRIRNFAYLTDVSEIPAESMNSLKGLDVLLLDCLRYKTHPTHLNVEQSIAMAGLIDAKATYFIHMTHELDYETLGLQLPQGLHVGFDGLRVQLA